MYPSRLLLMLGGRSAGTQEALADIPHLDFRIRRPGELTADDLNWADSWTGFELPDGAADSAISWFHSGSEGIEGYLPHFRTFAQRGAILTNTVGSMPHRIGEYVVGAVLSGIREFPLYRAQQEARVWERHGIPTAENMVAVVVGTGHIGSGIARLLRPFVAEVHGVSRSGRPVPDFDSCAQFPATELFQRADIIAVALPHTPDTVGLLSDNVFANTHDAILVNVGRGTTIDPAALHDALDAGRIRHATLDVFETEPLPADDWRWTHPGVTITPHVAGVTTVEDVATALRANLLAIRDGKPGPNQIDLTGTY